MINKQLIDYIKNESQRGVPQESTKNALLGIGWKDTDIKEAYASLSVTPTKSKFSKKFIFIPILLLLLALGGFFGYKFYVSSLKLEQRPYLPVELPIQNPTPDNTMVTPPAPVIISDVDKVKIIMNEICQGYVSGDNSLIIKNSSMQTATLVFDEKLNPVSTCTVNKISELDKNIIAYITIIELPSAKPTTEGQSTKNMVFVNEGGIWKYDLTISEKFTADQNKIKVLEGDQSGSVDLVITSAVVSTKHPIVNNKDLKITLTIKNIGTKTSDEGTPLLASLEGFKDQTSQVGGNYEPILPGGTAEWVWYPYKYNTLLKVSDVAGPKTIKIELNPNRKIVESNYDNNIFTQAVQMYAK